MKILIAMAAVTLALSLPSVASAQSITDMRGQDAGPQASREDRPDRHRGRPMADRGDRQERGARYRIQNGKMKISFHCPDGEPAEQCADLLLQVLDRLQADGASDERVSRGDDRRQLYRD